MCPPTPIYLLFRLSVANATTLVAWTGASQLFALIGAPQRLGSIAILAVLNSGMVGMEQSIEAMAFGLKNVLGQPIVVQITKRRTVHQLGSEEILNPGENLSDPLQKCKGPAY